MLPGLSALITINLISTARAYTQDITLELSGTPTLETIIGNDTYTTTYWNNTLNVTELAACVGLTQIEDLGLFATTDGSKILTYANNNTIENLDQWIDCLAEQDVDTAIYVGHSAIDEDRLIGTYDSIQRNIVNWISDEHVISRLQHPGHCV